MRERDVNQGVDIYSPHFGCWRSKEGPDCRVLKLQWRCDSTVPNVSDCEHWHPVGVVITRPGVLTVLFVVDIFDRSTTGRCKTMNVHRIDQKI